VAETDDANPTGPTAPPGGLTAPVVRGGRWLFLATSLVYVLRFLRGLVLMPLLDPADFGLFFTVLFALNVLRIFSETGVANIVVQRDDGDSAPVLMTAWWINAVRGLLLATVLALCAPMLTRLFDAQPRLTTILRAVSVIFVMEGFQSAGMITAVRELAFNRVVLVQQGSALVAVVTAIVLGVVFRDVTALVVGEIAGGVLLLVLSYIVVPVRPRFAARRRLARELWKLGKYLYLTHVFVFLLQQGDVLVVGGLLGVQQLGIYRLAYNYGNLPSQLIGQVVNRVMFPAYARIKDDALRLKRSLLRAQRFVVIIAVPACIALIALAPAMTAYGGRDYSGPAVAAGMVAMQLSAPVAASVPAAATCSTTTAPPWRYAGLTLPLQLFAVGVFFACLNALNVSLLVALGRPERVTRITLMQLVVWAALIFPMTMAWGLRGAAAITLLQFPAWLLLAVDNHRTIDCGVGEQTRNQLFIVPAAAAMIVSAVVLWVMLREHVFWYAGAFIVLGGATFVAALFVSARERLREFLFVVRQALESTTGATVSSPLSPGEARARECGKK